MKSEVVAHFNSFVATYKSMVNKIAAIKVGYDSWKDVCMVATFGIIYPETMIKKYGQGQCTTM